jgi:hypothetical protein
MTNLLLSGLYKVVSMLISSINFNDLAALCIKLDSTDSGLANSEKHEIVVVAAKSLGLKFSSNFLDAIVKIILEWARTRAAL